MRTLSPPWRKVLIGSWIMIAVLSVTTLILYVDNKRTKECISTYMVNNARNTKARSDLAEQERQAFKGVLKTVVTEPDAAKRRQVVADYRTLLDHNDEIRAQNPPLPVPTACD